VTLLLFYLSSVVSFPRNQLIWIAKRAPEVCGFLLFYVSSVVPFSSAEPAPMDSEESAISHGVPRASRAAAPPFFCAFPGNLHEHTRRHSHCTSLQTDRSIAIAICTNGLFGCPHHPTWLVSSEAGCPHHEPGCAYTLQFVWLYVFNQIKRDVFD
jgi:hypothetical protein